jgi:tetratricopeptide (TPR) repeat protein
VVLATLLLSLGCCTYFISLDAQRSRQQLQRVAANLLHTNQQLDALFQKHWNAIPDGQPLRRSDRELLDTWIRYDTTYVYENAGQADCRFTLATIHRRIGETAQLLGDQAAADKHFRKAIELFQQLAEDEPSACTNAAEAADTLTRLAWVARARGDPESARRATDRALKLMESAPLRGQDDFNAQCAFAYNSLGDLANLQDEPEFARLMWERSVQIFVALSKAFPNASDYQEQARQIQGKLGAMSQAGS